MEPKFTIENFIPRQDLYFAILQGDKLELYETEPFSVTKMMTVRRKPATPLAPVLLIELKDYIPVLFPGTLFVGKMYQPQYPILLHPILANGAAPFLYFQTSSVKEDWYLELRAVHAGKNVLQTSYSREILISFHSIRGKRR